MSALVTLGDAERARERTERAMLLDPENFNLLYNLGCNGVGFLPSIYGGRRVARIVAGESLPPSLFDPP